MALHCLPCSLCQSLTNVISINPNKRAPTEEAVDTIRSSNPQCSQQEPAVIQQGSRLEQKELRSAGIRARMVLKPQMVASELRNHTTDRNVVNRAEILLAAKSTTAP